MLVRLIYEVSGRMYTFLLFFIFWTVMFSWLFRICGTNIDQKQIQNEYTGLSLQMTQIIQVFRNTIGDIQVPNYEIWQQKDANGNLPMISVLMIYYVWFLWFINTMFMLIMLLNLLISIIS